MRWTEVAKRRNCQPKTVILLTWLSIQKVIFAPEKYVDLKERNILIRQVKHIAKKNGKNEIIFTILKENYKITLKTIFSKFSHQRIHTHSLYIFSTLNHGMKNYGILFTVNGVRPYEILSS